MLDSRFLSLLDREQIAELSTAGASIRAVAAVLGRPAPTVSRELAHNTDPDDPDRRYPPSRPTAPPPLAGPA